MRNQQQNSQDTWNTISTQGEVWSHRSRAKNPYILCVLNWEATTISTSKVASKGHHKSNFTTIYTKHWWHQKSNIPSSKANWQKNRKLREMRKEKKKKPQFWSQSTREQPRKGGGYCKWRSNKLVKADWKLHGMTWKGHVEAQQRCGLMDPHKVLLQLRTTLVEAEGSSHQALGICRSQRR